MTYQVLARKWRPQNFSDYVGQTHITTALKNALSRNTLHHAYLFTGTRGVGKTSIARILAKSLNCETGISTNPCGICSICKEITKGQFIDLYEIDAASRTKVEDTREILEHVKYQPTRGRYKIYLIDEVHMLSGHSFNALLKTLEEPPEHVKFLLATTDPQKLPTTVVSRCLQFHLHTMTMVQIQQHLQKILATENFSYTEDAIAMLAKAAQGSMRDALSLLEQALAYTTNKSLTLEQTTALLGCLPNTNIYLLLEALIERDVNKLMQQIEDSAKKNIQFLNALDQILETLHQISLQQLYTQSGDKKIAALSKLLTPEQVQLYYQICLHGKRDITYAPTEKIGFEMTLLRMLAFTPNNSNFFDLLKTNMQDCASARSDTNTACVKDKLSSSTQTQLPETQPVTEQSSSPKPSPSEPTTANNWMTVVQSLNLSGFSAEIIRHSCFKSKQGKIIHIQLAPNKKSLLNQKHIERINTALTSYYQEATTINIISEQPSNSTTSEQLDQQVSEKKAHTLDKIKDNTTFKAVIETFDASIQTDSLTLPTDESTVV